MTVTRAYLVGPAPDASARVAGLSVVLRALLALQDAGVEEIVLRGLSADDLPQDARLRLRVLPGDAAPVPALVAFANTVWHPAITQRLVRTHVEGGEIVAVGSPRPLLFVAGAEAVERCCSRQLSAEEAQAAFLAPAEFVLAVESHEARQHAEELLLASLLKPTDGIISRHLNRKISLWISSKLLNTSLTPNQMTLIAAVFGLAGVFFAWRGGFWGLVGGALLLQVQSILDGCDGELARLKYLRGRLGEWLDQISDDVINISFLAAVGLSLAREGSSWAAWVTLVSVVAHTCYQLSLYAAFVFKAGGRGSVTTIRWWGQNQNATPPRTPFSKGFARLKQLFEDAGKRDFFTFAYLPCALLGFVAPAFLWHAIIATVSGVVTSLQWLVAGGPEAVK
jgi:phosphatidylglycerophosphate synthase